MKQLLILPTLLGTLLFTSCSMPSLDFASTHAEQQTGYSYIPVEPLSVDLVCDGKPCKDISKRQLLNALPDNSVRIATRKISGGASVGIPTIGSNIGVAGNSYEVIIDYVNTQTVNTVFIGKWRIGFNPDREPTRQCYPIERSVLEQPSTNSDEIWSLRADLLVKDENRYLNTTNIFARKGPSIPQAISVKARIDEFDKREAEKPELKFLRFQCPKGFSLPTSYNQVRVESERFNVPVYYGIGLRLKASVTVLKGNVDLTSLPALSAAVSAGKAVGTMSVQTIGITGKAARSNLLLLNKIDETTIQNAIQVLASIKASIESEDTVITPRVLGFHNTIGAGVQGVNLIHSRLTQGERKLIIDDNTYADEVVAE